MAPNQGVSSALVTARINEVNARRKRKSRARFARSAIAVLFVLLLIVVAISNQTEIGENSESRSGSPAMLL